MKCHINNSEITVCLKGVFFKFIDLVETARSLLNQTRISHKNHLPMQRTRRSRETQKREGKKIEENKLKVKHNGLTITKLL